MTIQFSIDQQDYLTFQLFTASRSVNINRKRFRNKALIPLVYFAFGLWFSLQGQIIPVVVFFLVGVLWYLFYPKWDKGNFERRYNNFIAKNYKDSFNKKAEMIFQSDNFVVNDFVNKLKFNYKEIEEITEIGSMFLIKL